MSVYDNDPRVWSLGSQTYEVEIGTERVPVWYFADFGVWRTGVDRREALSTGGFATADEAIHSLIGDPQ